MLNVPYKIVPIAFLICFQPVVHGQYTWPLDKNEYRLYLQESWIVSDEHYDDDGNIMPNLGEYGYFATSLQTRYGISKRLNGFLLFPTYNYTYFRLPISDQKQRHWRAGDGEVGITYVIRQDSSFAWTGSLHIGLPFGDNRGILPTGDREYDQLLRLDLIDKTQLFNSNAWWGLYAGYNNRNDVYADEWHYGLEAGLYLASDKMCVSALLSGSEAIGDSNGAEKLVPQSLFSNFREYLIITPEIRLQLIPAWDVRLGLIAYLSGRNIFSGTTYQIGLSYYKS